MKHLQQMNSKKLFLGTMLLSAALMTGSLSSCKKDDNPNANTEITTDDAADAVEYATSTQTNGLASITVEASSFAGQLNVYSHTPSLNCGQIYNGTTSASFSGVNYAYNYTVTRTYNINCDGNNIHQSFDYKVSRSGNYNAPRMSATSSGNGTLQITGLDPNIANAIFNGTYTSTTTHQSKVRFKRSFTSTITYTLTNVTLSKTLNKLVSGVAAVNFAGLSSNGKTYNYTGTLNFNADGTAVLVLNGITYNITVQLN